MALFSFRKDKRPAKDVAAEEPAEAKRSWLGRLKQGLAKTSALLNTDVRDLVQIRRAIDADLLEELETQLLVADLGVEATQAIIKDLTARVSRKQLKDGEALIAALREDMRAMLEPVSRPLLIDTARRPYVVLVVGVNGAGKTTTIGKLAHLLKADGLSVMLAAGDTFRAAAVEQLQTWGARNDVPVIAQPTGADAASVVFDALGAARARDIDVLIADTAGRLHTQSNLMDELRKVKRVIAKLDAEAPHETLLVVDAGTGQNALNQAQQFNDAVGVTGIALTKLDGTAKGGIIFAIAKKLGVPIRFVGVGEKLEDLQPFDAEAFVDALLVEREQ